MRIIVTGGRNFINRRRIFSELDRIHLATTITQLVEGGAIGADRLAREWAHTRSVSTVTCPANWARYGRSAGMIRNIQMLEDFPTHMIVAFPGGRGTTGMILEAVTRDRQIIFIKEE